MIDGWLAVVACKAWRLLPLRSGHVPASLPVSDSHNAGLSDNGSNVDTVLRRLAAMMASMSMSDKVPEVGAVIAECEPAPNRHVGES